MLILFIFVWLVWEAVVQRCKKGVLRDFAKFTGKHLWQDLFLNACDVIKKEAVTQRFSSEFCKISKNIFSYKTPPVAASVVSIYVLTSFFIFLK